MSIPTHSPQVVTPDQFERRNSRQGFALRASRPFYLSFAAVLALHLSLHAQEKKDPPKHFTNSIGMEFRKSWSGSVGFGSPTAIRAAAL